MSVTEEVTNGDVKQRGGADLSYVRRYLNSGYTRLPYYPGEDSPWAPSPKESANSQACKITSH